MPNQIKQILASLKKNYEFFFLFIFLVYFIFISSYQISVPWDNSHKGYVGSQRSLYALKFMGSSISEHKFAQMWNTDWFDRTTEFHYKYYFHHPPGITYLLWITFSIFGVSEAIARLAPILLNLGILILFYLTVRTLFKKIMALISIFYLLTSPLFFYIRNFVAPEVMAVFFISLLSFFYACWLKKKNNKYLIMLIAGFFFGSLSDWQIYFFLPAIILHYLLFIRKEYNVDKYFLFIFILPFLSIGLYFLYVYLVTGSIGGENTNLGGNLFQTLFFRMNISSNSYDITFLKLLSNFWRDLSDYFTPVFTIIFIGGMLLFCWASLKKREFYLEMFFIFLFLSLSSSLFILGNLYYIHNYIIMIVLTSFFPIMILSIFKFGSMIRKQNRYFFLFIIFLVLSSIYLTSSYKLTRKLAMDELNTFPLVPFLKENPENFISIYASHPEAFQTRYYHRNRKIVYITDFEDLKKILDGNKQSEEFRYVISKSEELEKKDRRINELLLDYPAQKLPYDWIVFKLY